MWKSVLTGIILENIETIKYYEDVKGHSNSTVENILQYISDILTDLPWYFYFPVKILASIIGLLCLLRTGQKLDLLSSEKRSSFLRRVQFISPFSMLNKLVRSMAFLKLFDGFPHSTDN